MPVLEAAASALPPSIADLELDFLGRKLLDDDEFEAARRNGERLWDDDRVARALREYRQFLALMLWHPDAFLVPSEDIDEVWHAHVLHTARYESDCELIFGRFQHHAPSAGAADEVDEEHSHGVDETLALFIAAFGDAPQSYNVCEVYKCGRIGTARKCGRITRKCGRMNARKCGRVTRKCGRIERKCGRAAAKCGRVGVQRKCGRG